MSYASKIKEEIYMTRPSKSKLYKAFCYGLLLFGKKFSRTSVMISTEHITVSKLYGYVIKDLISQKASFFEQKAPRGTSLYTVELIDCAEIARLMKALDHDEEHINMSLIEGEALPMFLCGAFMACGTVSEPTKSYHMELIAPNDELSDILFEQLSTLGYPPKSMIRRGQTVLYFKESEQIEDLLTMIGATKCSLELMETKIYKDLRNRANRAANCDAANADKLLKAALQQLDDISLLKKHKVFDLLPPQAVAVAGLREQYTDASLSELSKLSGLSRSGINHRFNQIAQAAAKLRAEREEI